MQVSKFTTGRSLRAHRLWRLLAGHQEEAILADRLPDRLTTVPGPRLDALHERVVDRDRDVHDGGFVLRHRCLELEIVHGDDGELLRRHAVALGGVAVPRECRAGVAALAGRQHDRTADALRERLLEDAAVDDLDRDRGLLRLAHALLPPIRRRISSPTALMWSAAARRAASGACAVSALRTRRGASSDAG